MYFLIQCIPILVDGHRIRQCYRDNMAKIMFDRYGKSPDFWRTVDEKIVSDWASYHADLNYSGDDGIADIHEGLFRVTRALFKIAQITEPPKPDITALANELISSPYKNALKPNVMLILEKCREKNYIIGTFSYFLENQLQAITSEMPNLEHVIGADTLNHYEHDLSYFHKMSAYLKASPDTITIVATSAKIISAATDAGMQTMLVGQSSTSLIETLKQYL